MNINDCEDVDARDRGTEEFRNEHLDKRDWVGRYHNLRKLAVTALGRECTGCGETKINELHIIALTPESKGMNQVTFYRRVVAAYKRDPSIDKLAPRAFAELRCKVCRYYDMGVAAANRKKEKREEAAKAKEAVKEAGMFYWVAGERVQQLPPGSTGLYKGEQLAMPNVFQHEDLRLDGED